MSNSSILEMLNRIRNANLAQHLFVSISHTNITESLTKVLIRENLIKNFKFYKKNKKKLIIISLLYHIETRGKLTPVIKKIQSVSKPGLRVYSKVKNVNRILNGFGIAVMSTSSGLVTDQVARDLNLGGEILCYIYPNWKVLLTIKKSL